MNKAGILCLLLLMLTQSACAASFDCNKASTKVEKMICADAELSKLDEGLGAAYSKALKESSDPSTFKQQQRAWLKERNKCTATKCMKQAYEMRMTTLSLHVSDDNFGEDIYSNKTKEPQKKLAAYKFKLREDADRTVCHDFVKNLNKVQPVKASFSCSVEFDPEMKQLSWPQWEELKIEDHWDEVYEIESRIYRSQKIPSFGVWKKQYLEDMHAGYARKFMRGVFHPRLRRTRVRFETGGDLETILAYTRERNSDERCKDLVAKCMNENEPRTTKSTTECIRKWSLNRQVSKEAPGEHIVVYNSNNHQVRFILSGGKGSGASSNGLFHVFLHDGNAYLVLFSVSGISISQIKKVVPDQQGMTPWEYGERICGVSSAYPRNSRQ
ncbi:lysozyme inhibitor LprI family protein [Pseudomonadota bacterium]